ncbi:PREDICTED: glutathione S-transferase T3-like [Brassica oleracea var. oleracea]|uniref:glutathione S-transferase T3-like n=1 Tax=Brassica oleracea var. oleracea TaxID=109376 RepID=UPI0006A71978|nr:PREDICTED: glutathione S-transferase T3-like [Brassica oleracea var. oleracea]
MMMKRVSSDNCGYVGAAWETVNESKETVNESVEDKGLAGSSKIQRSHKDVKPSIFKFIGVDTFIGIVYVRIKWIFEKAIAFWKRIAAYFGSSPQLAGYQKRDTTCCKSRWGKINEGVCKFVGCYDAATKQKSSGQSEDDVLKMAHDIFFNDYKSKFTLEHAWLELRHDQKWCGGLASKENVSSKRRKLDDQSPQSSTSVPCSLGGDEPTARPAGVKAAKGKSKAAVSKGKTSEAEGKLCVDFQNMWEIKQKDFVL